jgi:hypothetical protein
MQDESIIDDVDEQLRVLGEFLRCQVVVEFFAGLEQSHEDWYRAIMVAPNDLGTFVGREQLIAEERMREEIKQELLGLPAVLREYKQRKEAESDETEND